MFSRNTVMIIAELNYSNYSYWSVVVLGHNAVGWHSEHWHWLLVGILCGGETRCANWFIFSIYNLICSIVQSYTPVFHHHPRHAKTNNKTFALDKAPHCWWYKQASLTATQRPNISEGECALKGQQQQQQQEGEDEGIQLLQLKEGLSWTETSQRPRFQSSPAPALMPACVYWPPCSLTEPLSMLHANMMLFCYSTSCTAMLWSILVYSYPWVESSGLTCFRCQIQGDKEKLLYELDSVQAELEKCRMISERWDPEIDLSLHSVHLHFKYFIYIIRSRQIIYVMWTTVFRIFIHIVLQATEGEGGRAGRHRLQEGAIRQTAGRCHPSPCCCHSETRCLTVYWCGSTRSNSIPSLLSLSLDLFTEQRLNVTFQGLLSSKEKT